MSLSNNSRLISSDTVEMLLDRPDQTCGLRFVGIVAGFFVESGGKNRDLSLSSRLGHVDGVSS